VKPTAPTTNRIAPAANRKPRNLTKKRMLRPICLAAIQPSGRLRANPP
jgi:hypothetical protein